VIDCDQPGVEGGVVERGEAQAVAGIKAVGGEFAPGVENSNRDGSGILTGTALNYRWRG
jgi:hypothetical protein